MSTSEEIISLHKQYVMSTYAPGAVVVGDPGQPKRGDAALRAMFAAFIESGVSFNYGEHEVVIAGDAIR